VAILKVDINKNRELRYLLSNSGVLYMKYGLFKRSASLLNELLVLFRVPIENFHGTKVITNVCLLSSIRSVRGLGS